MKERYIVPSIAELCLADHKMTFLSGPRQCGKTTLAKMLLAQRGAGEYYSWDDVEFRRLWARTPSQSVRAAPSVPIVIYDEIHKAKAWKRTLKGIFDTLVFPADIVVTGSARLNVYRKGGDSLVGRYYHFRLHPFSIGEVTGTPIEGPDGSLQRLMQHSFEPRPARQEAFETMLKFGAFPEPFLGQNERKARLWRSTRVDRVIQEDLRDLSRIPELSRIQMLASLIPERVGSPFSVQPLREVLEVSYDTARRWVEMLRQLYYLFEVKPYFRRVARSLRKEGKVYLWDFSEALDDGARLENLVACHLLKACDFWTDTGYGKFTLAYLRNKEKQEIDFLLVRDGAPWLAVEVKTTDTTPSPHFARFLPELGCPAALQVVRSPNIWSVHSVAGANVVVASAAEALACFV